MVDKNKYRLMSAPKDDLGCAKCCFNTFTCEEHKGYDDCKDTNQYFEEIKSVDVTYNSDGDITVNGTPIRSVTKELAVIEAIHIMGYEVNINTKP